ncbi:ATP-binding protein [Candidatus Micrarchaeota archaeon]|nr:ATP-binding protein [Candidatus Micrarchaeota archaeon]
MIRMKGTDVVVCCGMRGSGKSHFMRSVVKNTPRYVLWDPMREHGSLGMKVESLDQLRVAMRLNQKIVFQGRTRSQEEFEDVAALVYKAGGFFLFVDEADQVMPSRKIGPRAKEFIDLGRHRNVGMFCVTRRIADLDKAPVAQVNHLFVFRTIMPQDLEYLRGFIGDDAFKAKDLSGFRFLHFDGGHVVEHEKI